MSRRLGQSQERAWGRRTTMTMTTATTRSMGSAETPCIHNMARYVAVALSADASTEPDGIWISGLDGRALIGPSTGVSARCAGLARIACPADARHATRAGTCDPPPDRRTAPAARLEGRPGRPILKVRRPDACGPGVGEHRRRCAVGWAMTLNRQRRSCTSTLSVSRRIRARLGYCERSECAEGSVRARNVLLTTNAFIAVDSDSCLIAAVFRR